MEFLDFLPALNDLAVGALAIIVLAWIFKNTLDAFQDQSLRHDQQTNKLVQALSENNEKLGDLVEIVKDGAERDEDIYEELRNQQEKIDVIIETVDEIKGSVKKVD